MKQRIKFLVNKLLSFIGFRIIRSDDTQVSFDNFLNLTTAYEGRLNEMKGDVYLSNDELRPRLLSRLLGTPPSEAYYIIQALVSTATIEGDICEFGVAQGETSALIANEIKDQNKILHLFDSFQGLPKPTEKDKLIDDIFSLGNIDAYTGTMSSPESLVRSRMKAISFPKERFVIHKGFIEKLIFKDTKLPKKVSFAYIDFDFYEPTKIALEFVNNIASQNAVIIVDDYDFFSTGVREAVDEFIHKHNSCKLKYDIYIPDKLYGCFAVLTKKVGMSYIEFR